MELAFQILAHNFWALSSPLGLDFPKLGATSLSIFQIKNKNP